MAKYKRVQVNWMDPVSYQSWTDTDVAITKLPEQVENVGWLIHKPTTEHPYYILAGQLASRSETADHVNPEQVADFIVIPKGCVVSIKLLTARK